MKKIYTFRVILEPDENNTFHGFVPSLPGCHTWGESIEATKKNLREAIQCHIEGLLMDDEPIPHEEDVIELIQTFSDQDFAVKKQNKKTPAWKPPADETPRWAQNYDSSAFR